MNQNYPQVYPAPNNKKPQNMWITCGIIGLVGICVGVVLLMGGFGALVAVFGPEPEGLDVSFEMPATVDVGQEFNLVLTMRNSGSSEITVTEIQLPKTLLEGAALLKMTPKGSDTTDYSDTTGYTVTLILAPGESSTITYDFKALTAGDYSGTLSVGVRNRRKNADIRLVVEGNPSQTGLTIQAPVPINSGEDKSLTSEKIPYQAVVQILAFVNTGQGEEQAWWGSGTIVSADGLILTNAHVVSSTKEYQLSNLMIAMTVAQDQPPETRYYADVKQLDESLDVAVIQITRDLDGNPVDRSNLNLPHVPLGDSDALKLGDPIVVIGYPGIGGETVTLTRGEVSGFTAQPEYGNRAFIKTSATIAGGNSGGLATNDKGEIIGIPTQLGYGGEDQYADCRTLVDTNGDNVVDEQDSCIPTGGFINALRPLKLALPYLNAAKQGEVNISEGVATNDEFVPSGSVILKDDFSNPASGWYVGSDETGSAEYNNGEYLLEVIPNDNITWVWLDNDLGDVIITTDVRPAQPTGTGGFGIICRHQANEDFYGLEIAEDGYFSIWKRINGEYTFLINWQESSSLPRGQAATVTAACVGNRLTLAVNDLILGEVVDSDLTSGNVGVFAETYDTGKLIAAFDNFTVRAP
jgi:S1-C subfamily serine protease